jgi:hypothetical protein
VIDESDVEEAKSRAKKTEQKQDPIQVSKHGQEALNLDSLIAIRERKLDRLARNMTESATSMARLKMERDLSIRKKGADLVLHKIIAMVSERFLKETDEKKLDIQSHRQEFLQFVSQLTGSEVLKIPH